MLKLKLKGLDMLLLVLQSNKQLIKEEDFLCVDTLLSLVSVAKGEKSLYEPMIKK
ncbi:MAG: hypothetical protein MJ252_29390 [archaeon]|nr:hypothetical protein [archaeon]